MANRKRRGARKRNHFNAIEKAPLPRSLVDLSHTVNSHCDGGQLIPILILEVLPGDAIQCRYNDFSRMAPLTVPVFHNAWMHVDFFAVPKRILWENFERFQGAQDNPGDSTDFLYPKVTVPNGVAAESDLPDMCGIPPLGLTTNEKTVNALPFRAQNLIWNTWYRDQDLQDSLPVPLDDGPDDPADYTIQRRAKIHDYFSSASPWPQKGDAVNIPLGTTAPVIPDPAQPFPSVFIGSTPDVDQLFSRGGTSPVHFGASGDPSGSGDYAASWFETGMQTDLSQAVGTTVNTLRTAALVQQYLERNARGGTRYVETLMSRWHVRSPDFRLQRPEYIGGGKTPINVHPVAATNDSNNVALGQLGAYGTTGGSSGFTYSATEHCFIIGYASVRAELKYETGLHKLWSRDSLFDEYDPIFANLGEQAVLSKEIFCDGTAGDETVFGYQERWAEYRQHPSMVVGRFRSYAQGTLAVWHWAQAYAQRPVLNAEFVEEDPPIGRSLNVTSGEPQFIIDGHFDIRAARQIPLYSTPGISRL